MLMTGMHHDAVIDLMVQAGQQCQDFLAFSVYQAQVKDVEVDEQWSFVYCKEKTAFNTNRGPGCQHAPHQPMEPRALLPN